MLLIHEHPEGITFKIFVQPRSAKNTIVGLHDDALKLKLTAAPVDNAANKMCVKYLAKSLKVPMGSIEIVSGHGSRTKSILLRYENEGVSEKAKRHLKARVTALLQAS